MDLSSPANLLIAGVYYVLAGGLTFFSLFGVYVLIRYGKSSLLSLTVAVFYAFIYLKILTESHQALAALLSQSI
jgi:hypothetical protein